MAAPRAQCPVCLSEDRTAALGGHLFGCASCGIAFNTKFEPKQYNEDYFLDEYRFQYGRSYIEDYEAIRRLSERRLDSILRLFYKRRKPSSLALLDIGSAAGFFLKCARDAGILDANGIEASEYAADYCSATFGIPVTRASFEDVSIDRGYDIITAWYFIEHCADPVPAIEKIYSALRPRGVFAFSVPSIFGPMFAFRRKAWVESHPSDHRVDFSPRFAKSLARKTGYKRIYVKPAGIHPERVIPTGSAFYKPFSHVYRTFSRITAFSDTIEVYAVK
jgi:SAM-dependent methyltransferase